MARDKRGAAMTFTLAHIEQLKRDGKIKKYRYYIGIDPGVNTGYASWNSYEKEFITIDTLPIHTAMQRVFNVYNMATAIAQPLFVRVEDARKRKWFGKADREQLQGAGSIKRDCKIWEDFLTDLGIDFEMVAPKNNKTKMTADAFRKLTKWEGRTDQHNRDASMLVFGI